MFAIARNYITIGDHLAEEILGYCRYTHRVAISNHRIVDIEDGQVKFLWRDYRNNNANLLFFLGFMVVSDPDSSLVRF